MLAKVQALVVPGAVKGGRTVRPSRETKFSPGRERAVHPRLISHEPGGRHLGHVNVTPDLNVPVGL